MVIRENDPRQDNHTTVECDYGIAERLFLNSREEGGKMKTSSCAGRIVLLIAPALFFSKGKYGNKVTPQNKTLFL